jgi:hypothetical protein
VIKHVPDYCGEGWRHAPATVHCRSLRGPICRTLIETRDSSSINLYTLASQFNKIWLLLPSFSLLITSQYNTPTSKKTLRKKTYQNAKRGEGSVVSTLQRYGPAPGFYSGTCAPHVMPNAIRIKMTGSL